MAYRLPLSKNPLSYTFLGMDLGWECGSSGRAPT
jgi:hypothetical protein